MKLAHKSRENVMRSCYFFIVLMSSLVYISCSKNPAKPDPSESDSILFQRNIEYDAAILTEHGVDSLDFKKSYSHKELEEIFTSATMNGIEGHLDILVDDDLVYFNIYTLAYGAFDIVQAEVKEVEPQWDESLQFIQTLTRLSITKSYKNSLTIGDTMLCDLGGNLDSMATAIPYNPPAEYLEGESVLVFIVKRDDQLCTFGGAQGKFNKIDD